MGEESVGGDVPSAESMREQAEGLAQVHRREDPETTDVYWYPHQDELRLLEVATLLVR